MESIRKLHEWWLDTHRVMDSRLSREFSEHIDAIEREVKGMRDFCERLDDAATKREDVTLWGVDYMPYPLDAEGIPIHVGDVMEWPDCSTAEVVGIGNDTFFYVEEGDDAAEWSCANDKLHHHAPTVEDVLRELVAAYMDTPLDDSNDGEFFAKYAAKLRLAGDE